MCERGLGAWHREVGCQIKGFVAGVGGGDQELVLDMLKLNCLLDNGEKMLGIGVQSSGMQTEFEV